MVKRIVDEPSNNVDLVYSHPRVTFELAAIRE